MNETDILVKIINFFRKTSSYTIRGYDFM